jgi:O-antigen/teichoic acid export membrane protein
MANEPRAQEAGGRGIGHRVAVGAGWMVALRWIDRLIGVASIAILARLLLPEDFGLVGYAMLVAGLLELVSGTATDAALIRERDADPAFYEAAWTMNVVRGIVLGALMLALARPAADYFRVPDLEAVMLALATLPLLQGMVNVGMVNFRKQLNFGIEFQQVLLARVPATLVTIALAFAWRSYWALVVGTLLRAALAVGLGYWFHPFRARWNFARIPEMFRFSRWMMLQNLASGLNNKVPVFIIGREWNSSVLGFFNMSKELANLSTTEIRAPVRRALFPGLAQLAADPTRLNPALVDATGMLALLTLPIPLGIALVAPNLVPLFLGNQWETIVGMLRPLCIASAAYAIGTNSHLAFVVQNRSHLTAASEFVRLLLVVAAIAVAGIPNGVEGVAWAIAGVSAAMVVADYLVTPRLLGIDARRFVAAVIRPLVASATMCIVVLFADQGLSPANDVAGQALGLARSASLGVATYVVTVLALWRAAGRPEGAEQRLLDFVAQYRRRRSLPNLGP